MVYLVKIWICVFFLAGFFKSSSQENNVLANVDYSVNNYFFKTNPFTVFWSSIPMTGEYRFCFENRISRKSSVQVGGSYLGKSWFVLLMQDSLYASGEPHLNMHGYRFQFGYRYYFEDEDMTGFYCSPHFSYSSCKFFYKGMLARDEYIRCVHKNINLLMGYQKLMGDRVGIDLFFGLGIRENTWIERYNQQNTIIDDLDDFYPYDGNLKISLGFNFIYLLGSQ